MQNESTSLWQRLWPFNRATKAPRSTGAVSVHTPRLESAGVYVNETTALSVSAVWAATRYLQQTIAGLPVHVMQETTKGAERATSHPVQRLLGDRVSAEYSSYDFRELMVGWAIRYGNGVAEVELDQVGRPYAIHPIHPHRCVFRRADGPMSDAFGDAIPDGELYYEIDGQVRLSGRRVFHLKGYGADGPVGLSVVDFAAQTIGWAKANALFGAAFFANGANVGGIVSNKVGLSTEALEAQKSAFRLAHVGARNAFKTVHLDAEATYEPFTANLEQSQFVELNHFLIEEICRWVGVPPSKVWHLAEAHYNNVEHQSIEVVSDCLIPWVAKFEQEANYKLFGQNRRGYFVRMNMRGLLRGSFKEQNEGLEIARRNGVITTDEWRSYLDMNPVGTERGGDKLLVQAAQIDLVDVGKNFAAPAKAA